MATKNPNRGLPIKVVPHKLPDEISSYIGQIIYRWSKIQLGLTQLITFGFDIPIDTGRALTIGMEMNVLCGVLRTLSLGRWIKNESLRKEIQKLAKDIKNKSEARNSFAHCVFVTDVRNPKSLEKYLTHKSEHRIIPLLEKVEITKMKQLVDDADALLARLDFIIFELQPFSKKSP